MTTQGARASITVHLQVRLDEIDIMGIVHSSNYLKYMEHARAKLLEQQGVDLMAWVKKGIRAVLASDTLHYRHPATYGDTLAISCQVEEIGHTSARLGYGIVELRTGKEILEATTTVVAIDPSGKPIPIPQEIREVLSHSV